MIPLKRELVSSLKNNLAAVHLQNGSSNWNTVIELCSQVLALDPSNVKALYRRGVAYLELDEFTKARRDFQSAKILDPTNEVIATKLAAVSQKENQLSQKMYATAMRKMFQS